MHRQCSWTGNDAWTARHRTERAARRIGEILEREPAGAMLRVSVEGGGCSGFQYKFDIERAQADDDLVLARDGAAVLIDPVSLNYMAGSRDRFRRRPDRAVVQDQQSEGHRLLRLRHQLLALDAMPGPPTANSGLTPNDSSA